MQTGSRKKKKTYKSQHFELKKKKKFSVKFVMNILYFVN